MRVLFDNGVPWAIARSLSGHEVTYTRRIGWHELRNGDLIREADLAGYDVLLTTTRTYGINRTFQRAGSPFWS